MTGSATQHTMVAYERNESCVIKQP